MSIEELLNKNKIKGLTNTLKDSIDYLSRQVELLNAGEGHIMLHMEDKSTAVLSVYVEQRPSNLVLDELMEWAEENENQELVDKIQQLAVKKSS